MTDHEVPDPLLGTVLLEQFRIDAQIGTGGMGTVYRAHQTTVGRDVAIKVLRQELARDEEAVARFEREGRLAIALDHPNLVRVFLTGRLADGRLYIVMELLEGRTLAEELEHHGPPTIERSVILLLKLCAALGAVHAAGVVHRDIKPENVYLVRRGKDQDFVKLVDFGIARALQAESPVTTQNGRVFGTASYISPEAAVGDETDPRSDIYSLGVLAYQLLTGALPFEGSTVGAVLMQHVHREPPPISSKGRGAEVPAALAAVVMRSLRKNPNERPQSIAELLESIAEAAGHAGLLRDARALLLGTVWGDELAAPGSYLGDLLASSTPPAPIDETPPGRFERNAEEEALLSSAPTPFGTTSGDLPSVSGDALKRPWLWMALGMSTLVVGGLIAGAWWRDANAPSDHSERQVADEASPLVARGGPVPGEEQLANGTTGEPLSPSVEAPRGDVDMSDEAVVTDEPAPQTEARPSDESAAPRRSPRPPRKARVSRRSRPEAPAEAPASPPASAAKSAPVSPSNDLEPDEGIDWTVPGFPDEARATTPGASNQAPTGMPGAPARNPIVIDEPPGR